MRIRTLFVLGFLVGGVLALGDAAIAADGIRLRGGLPNLSRMLRAKERTRVVYFGGGVIYGKGASNSGKSCRSQFGRALHKAFAGASIAEYNKALPRTQSWLGACRVDGDVIRHYIPLGLVVIEFSADDRAEPAARVSAAVEGIVRRIWAKHKSADLLFVYAPGREDIAGYRAGKVAPAVPWYERIAEAYGIPSVDLGEVLASRDGLAPASVFADDIHPNDDGHALYGAAFTALVERVAGTAEDQTKPVVHSLPEATTDTLLKNGRLVTYEHSTFEPGWLGWQESPIDRFFHVLHCDTPGAMVTLTFKGDMVGLFGPVSSDTGDLEVSVDSGAWRGLPVFDARVGDASEARGQVIAEGLDPAAEHVVRVRVAGAVPAGSKGRHARLGFFAVNGTEVFANPYAGMNTLQRIDAMYAGMEPVTFTPSPDRWKHLSRTMKLLQDGPELRIVMLGDSIVNDTAHSHYQLLVDRLYPKCKVVKVVSVRGSTGCWWYKEEGRVEQYVLRHKPDLLMIGGISQRKDIESIQSVIHQVRAAKPDVEFFLMTGAFGFYDPRTHKDWTYDVDPNGDGYRGKVLRLAATENAEFLDMRGPWGKYIRNSKRAHGSFKRDPVHAHDRGKPILGRILERYFTPKN
ncbi:MAG: SGNH/GDSL hydrolase family protein [Lentisphaerae bacterium]|nr:SGNH/GDSL hydrolase family protein [Lentisphaerota bacterium]